MAGQRVWWEISLPFPQFCSEPQTALKHKVIIKKLKNGYKESQSDVNYNSKQMMYT